MSQTNQDFQAQDVKVSLKRSGDCKIAATIHLTPAAVNQCYQNAVKEIKKEVSLPGFRRGKAPDAIILDRYKRQIEQEWKEKLLNFAFDQTVKLSNAYPFNNQSISKAQIQQLSKENGAEIHFEYESHPVLPQINFSKIQVKRTVLPPITEEMVDHFLSQLRIETSDVEFIPEGTVQDGDVVITSIYKIEDPELPEEIDNHRVFLFEETGVTPWVYKQLKGQPIGGSVEDTLNLSDLLKGQPFDAKSSKLPIRVTVKQIARGNIPQIDDERAKTWGAESVTQLRERASDQLKKSLGVQIYNDHVNQAISHILDNHPFDLPQSLIKELVEESVQETLSEMRDQDFSNKDFKEHEERLRAEARFKVEKQLQLQYILQQIIDEKKITIDQNELNLAYIRDSFSRIQQGESPFEEEAGLSAQARNERTFEKLKALEHKLKRHAAYDAILAQVHWIEADNAN